MKLSSSKALELLNNSRGLSNDDKWIEHCICVGNAAGVIAKKLKLDDDLAKTLGYIHDIGKRNGYGKGFVVHELSGYRYIKELGYDEEYARICLTHSFLNNDISCVAGGLLSLTDNEYDFLKEYIKNHEYTIYEKIINLCDLTCKQRNMTLEQRLIDIFSRYGVYENSIYHIEEAKKLKKYFDNLLGYNTYDLFPTIKENL